MKKISFSIIVFILTIFSFGSTFGANQGDTYTTTESKSVKCGRSVYKKIYHYKCNGNNLVCVDGGRPLQQQAGQEIVDCNNLGGYGTCVDRKYYADLMKLDETCGNNVFFCTNHGKPKDEYKTVSTTFCHYISAVNSRSPCSSDDDEKVATDVDRSTVEGNSCSHVPLTADCENGTCGSDNGSDIYILTDKCSKGTEDSVVYDNNSFSWTWNCLGINGGTSTSCSANKKIDGVCNSGSNQTNTDPGCMNEGGNLSYVESSYIPSTLQNIKPADAPSYASTERASSIKGLWTCNGINGGTNANCEEYTWITYDNPSWRVCKDLTNWDNTGKAICTKYRTVTPTRYYNFGKATINGPQSDMRVGEKFVHTIELNLNNSASSCDNTNLYANNEDKCNIRFNIDGIPSEGIEGLENQQAKDIDYTDISSDKINNSGQDGVIEPISSSIIKLGITNYYLDLSGFKSVVPFKKDDGILSFNIYKSSGGLISSIINKGGVAMNFKKPFKGSLEIDGDDFKIGTEQTLKLNINKKDDITGSDNCTQCNTYNIENFMYSLESTNTGYIIFKKDDEENLSNNPILNFTLNYTSNDPIGTTGISVKPYISYILGGKNVRYVLSKTNNPEDISEIQLGGADFVGVKIVGSLQGQGKQTITHQKENFTSLDKSLIERDLKKNIYMQIKSMSSNQVLNGVKFVEGDTMITGDNLGYETLVIKDGNLTIHGDSLNKNGDKLGIILIKSDMGDKTKGNVYIKPDVKYINAIIYADGSIISVDNSASLYTSDSAERTKDLQNQLVIKGTIFTENTIGGAILSSSNNFILPGGETTTDFYEAMKYDLNYVRRGNNGWDGSDNNGDGNIYNEGYDDPFVIIYNPEVQSNPPKLFSK